MKDLIIFRGLPGSGKTTLAALLADGRWPVLSIDDYFTDSATGRYAFDHAKNHLAYSACLSATEAAMKKGTERIFLHNTFTLEWEMEPYFGLAKAYGYRVFVATLENRHHGGNIHGISGDQLRKMAEKYKVVLL